MRSILFLSKISLRNLSKRNIHKRINLSKRNMYKMQKDYCWVNFFILQVLPPSHLGNDTQKHIELQRRQQEHLIQQHQKLQELHGQLTAQYATASNPPLSRQGLMFLPYFEQLRSLQQATTLPPSVPKSPLENHVIIFVL